MTQTGLDAVTRTAFTHNHNVMISGGDKSTPHIMQTSLIVTSREYSSRHILMRCASTVVCLTGS
jgi:hypothetical protein